MFNRMLRYLGVIILGLIFGLIGLVAGTLMGGNYFTEFEFLGVRGYEALGQVSFIIGTLIGLVSGWWLLVHRKPG